METKILTTSTEDIKTAAKIIREGGIVAFPTETVYGLGANALNAAAVKKIYAAKGRPQDNPMIVHVKAAADVKLLTPDLSDLATSLMERFWPGPLTLIVEKKREVPYETTGGLSTVAVRMPDEPVALELINMAGTPIAAPSANLSGKPSPTRAAHVIADLTGKVDAIIAGGDCRIGIESTVMDITCEIPTILRPGFITVEDIRAVTGGKVDFDPSLFAEKPTEPAEFKPKSPGMKYKHYAPKAEMIIFEGCPDDVKKEIGRVRSQEEVRGKKVGELLFEEKAFYEAAHELFSRLRELDDQGVDLILAGALAGNDGLGFAVMNRMLKAAGYNVVKI